MNSRDYSISLSLSLIVHRRSNRIAHSSLRKSKVLDFSVGNWEKVLLLFTRLPGVLYFTLDCESTFLMAGELEELKSLLKLQVVKGETGVQGRVRTEGSLTPTLAVRGHRACWELGGFPQ